MDPEARWTLRPGGTSGQVEPEARLDLRDLRGSSYPLVSLLLLKLLLFQTAPAVPGQDGRSREGPSPLPRVEGTAHVAAARCMAAVVCAAAVACRRCHRVPQMRGVPQPSRQAAAGAAALLSAIETSGFQEIEAGQDGCRWGHDGGDHGANRGGLGTLDCGLATLHCGLATLFCGLMTRLWSADPAAVW